MVWGCYYCIFYPDWFVFLKKGHKKSISNLSINQAVGREEYNYFLKKIHLFYLVIGYLILGLFLRFIESLNSISLFSSVLILFYCIPAYWWYFKDKKFCRFKSSWVLNMAVIVFPFLGLPIYIFKSRKKPQDQLVFSHFLVVLTILWSGLNVGRASWDLLTTLNAV
jgi:hypothetical protein